MKMIDPGTIDIRHESLRLKRRSKEYDLLSSMLVTGIQSPLIGVELSDGACILFDGFKRLRVAKVMGLTSLPFESIAGEECDGICEFVRRNISDCINILEQAAFIQHLQSRFELSVGQIAKHLSRSIGWVSMRRTLLGELSETVRRHIFADDFPVYAYMYFIRPFMRMNVATSDEVDKFVEAVSGKQLTIREIESLAYGYFKGPVEFRELIHRGEIAWALKRCQGLFRNPMPSCSASEIDLLRGLEGFHDELLKLKVGLSSDLVKSQSFFAQAGLLAQRLIESLPDFSKLLRDFYDRSRNP